MRLLCLCLLLSSAVSSVHAEDIKVLTWNVESNRDNRTTNNPAVIARKLKLLQSTSGPYDLIGLTEVAASSAGTYTDAFAADGLAYQAFLSASGNTDRMLILVRRDRFTIEGNRAEELQNDGGSISFPGGSARQPFLVTVTDSKNDDLTFRFMVNHLNRGNSNSRQQQAKGLREWARRQSLPIVAVGDYNFDFDFRNLTGNPSMSMFMRLDPAERGLFVWNWIIPNATFAIDGATDATRKIRLDVTFTDTNWYDPQRDGFDDFRDSLLDFIFVAGPARNWAARSNVIQLPGDFPDNDHTSDHRPVDATFASSQTGPNIGGPHVISPGQMP